jgi:multidrug transporter EmrE-like cation transporter
MGCEMSNIFLIIVSVAMNALAQLAIRKGMLAVGDLGIQGGGLVSMMMRMLANGYLWLAMVLYGFSILLWMFVLSKVEVSFAYPFLSLGYGIVLVLGFFLFGEQVTLLRVAGVMVIVVGVILISRS